ncbi:DUF3265 domain-containing protein [Vibrio anguillarum]|uniref:DUF3265 domain-containing protein n=1 Tax=Vibrio anguillarum TaxID=55601 RepID=A0A7U6J5P9_VIBAN|nr:MULTISPECIES: DUF3265 domain-containing protein [Vibrio]AXN05250.1 DUF3265 domain-containing protein [Vibrio anguillarum]AZS26945.1 DUF3265 domain-containing protein [Vibrio anguillarum]MBT2916266.1 DUF3265 domain-containing protein [Vibrio anguillarum]
MSHFVLESKKHNKALKRDSCRVAFLVCGDFGGESGMRKVGLGGTHPLTRRYIHSEVT